MIQVSNAWVTTHEQNILPETFVELSYGIIDTEAQETAVGSGVNEAVFSTAENITKSVGAPRFATLERNLWALNGTRSLFYDGAGDNLGYASVDDGLASVTISFPEVRTSLLPGVTITWSSEFDEYALLFKVTVKNGETTIAETTQAGDSSTSVVNLDIENYDSITIDILEWSLPDHRARVDLITVGQGLTFTKHDLFSFEHEQFGDLNCGVLPKQHISFSLDNSTGRWNPDNPQGMEKYLSERQIVEVRYGMRVGNDIEWTKAGTYYMSEWNTPSQGMTANFVARDIFEYMLTEPYVGIKTGTLRELVEAAFACADIPQMVTFHLDEVLDNYTATIDDEYTAAEVVQLCANAAGCVVYQDRNGEVYVQPMSTIDSGYTVARRLAPTHPEVVLSKPIRGVKVQYVDDQMYTNTVSNSGELQTVHNPLISTEAQAAMVADEVANALITRKTVSGEFRADPRLDLYDIVTVESKYGNIHPVVLTDIKYRYSGSFWATYEGRVLSSEVVR